MKRGGIDIGSRFVKYVVLNDGGTTSFYKSETGHNPLSVCKRLISSDRPDKLTATGYGRHLMEVLDDTQTITEIKAVARGAKEVFPRCRTVIDIGGQDTKVVSLRADGRVLAFEMNDRCAAGTGRFMEIMAKALGYAISDFGQDCVADNDGNITINSMCTVFAESEVVSLINKGVGREQISRSLHLSIAQKVIALAKRVEVNEDIVFAGGCAKNRRLISILEDSFQKAIFVSESPDMLAALGAALY
ncbi:acyl-CoA dehydratase activase [Candidatus Magnetominusculus dajiuhuensis]|uniref:acyl-CoA dehydratase activase n=1 Tax=Candidatus Magnetominusculus dajiuhuensis TaxID=3137712 RepID=UPI003B4376B2